MISGSKTVKEGKGKELGLEKALKERQSLEKQKSRETRVCYKELYQLLFSLEITVQRHLAKT